MPKEGLWALLAVCGLFSACSEEVVPVEPAGSDFIRFVEEGPHAGRLETAVATYENPAGQRVDLIGAVHIADPAYYRLLQALFASYDAVLFEMIAPEDATRPRRGEHDSTNVLGNFQRNLCRMFELEFQLDGINYEQPNLVHADLTTGEFARIWNERGETVWTLFFEILAAQFEAVQKGAGRHLTGSAMIEAFRSGDSAARLKFLFAQEMEHIETMFAGLDPAGEAGSESERCSMIIGERNKAAIRVLERKLRRGADRLAIFYGVGHMPDLEARLQRGLGFFKKRHVWLTAWEVVPAKASGEGK